MMLEMLVVQNTEILHIDLNINPFILITKR